MRDLSKFRHKKLEQGQKSRRTGLGRTPESRKVCYPTHLLPPRPLPEFLYLQCESVIELAILFQGPGAGGGEGMQGGVELPDMPALSRHGGSWLLPECVKPQG